MNSYQTEREISGFLGFPEIGSSVASFNALDIFTIRINKPAAVNFINVLRAHFPYKILAPKTTKLAFGFEILAPKNFVQKMPV